MDDTPPPHVARLASLHRAADLLGGQRATARAIGIHERTMRALLGAERTIHDGFARDAADALDAHAECCRAEAVTLRATIHDIGKDTDT